MVKLIKKENVIEKWSDNYYISYNTPNFVKIIYLPNNSETARVPLCNVSHIIEEDIYLKD